MYKTQLVGKKVGFQGSTDSLKLYVEILGARKEPDNLFSEEWNAEKGLHDAAVENLVEHDNPDEVVDLIKPLLKSENKLARAGAVEVIGELKSSKYFNLIKPLIDDPSLTVKESVGLAV